MILDILGVAVLIFLSGARLSQLISGEWWALPLFLHVMLSVIFLVLHKTPRRMPPFLMRLTAWISAILPMFIRINAEIPIINRVISFSGVALAIWALLNLGRSFDVSPADRGLVHKGPYRIIRHPMYTGELLSMVSLVYLDLNVRNVFVAILFVITLIIRIRWEETIINGYEGYSKEIRSRLIPGVW